MRDLYPKLGKGPVDQREVARRAVAHHNLSSGNGTERQKGSDFMEVFVEAELSAAQRLATMHRQL